MWRQGWQQVYRESAVIGICTFGGKGHRQGHGGRCPLPLPPPATQSLRFLTLPIPPAPTLPLPLHGCPRLSYPLATLLLVLGIW